MRLIAVGRLSAPERALFGHYAARIRPTLAVAELAEGAGQPAEQRRREGAAILGALPAGGRVVALDLGGEALSSEGFAARLESWLAAGRPLCFVIGGAEGLDPAVITRADHLLSLGGMTWPHRLARIMLAEQIFRARAIAAGHPYHRGARP